MSQKPEIMNGGGFSGPDGSQVFSFGNKSKPITSVAIQTHINGSSRPGGDPEGLCIHKRICYNDDPMPGCGSYNWYRMCEDCGKVWKEDD